MQWSRMFLQAKTKTVDFIARWNHLYYKFVQYTFNKHIQNQGLLQWEGDKRGTPPVRCLAPTVPKLNFW